MKLLVHCSCSITHIYTVGRVSTESKVGLSYLIFIKHLDTFKPRSRRGRVDRQDTESTERCYVMKTSVL